MTEVRTVAVIGAGIMGRGIAHAAALGGYRTILEDLLPNALRKAETEIRANLDKAVELGKVNATDANAAFSRLEYAGSVDQAAREADQMGACQQNAIFLNALIFVVDLTAI